MGTLTDLEDPATRIVESTWALVLNDPSRAPSLRRIAAAADVNLAMVAYYFKSKEGLLSEMFFAYASPLIAERVRRLSLLTKSDLTLENVLAAWFASEFDETGSKRFRALAQMLSLHHAGLYKLLLSEAFDDGARNFVDAISGLLPDMARETVVCRFYATATAIAAADDPSAIESMNAINDGQPIDHERWMAELLSFAIAGFRQGVR